MEWGPRVCQQEIEKLKIRLDILEYSWCVFPPRDDIWQEKAATVEQFAASEGFRQAASLDLCYDDLTPEVACAVKLAVGDINV